MAVTCLSWRLGRQLKKSGNALNGPVMGMALLCEMMDTIAKEAFEAQKL
jgi:hypothetical protein